MYIEARDGFVYIKRLPDFDDIAVAVIRARRDKLDGDQYWLLTPVADAIEQRHPLAATIVLRAMSSVSLDAAKHKRYGHAARHLQTCAHLARRIEDFSGCPNHADHVADLRQRHARKSGF